LSLNDVYADSQEAGINSYSVTDSKLSTDEDRRFSNADEWGG